MLGSRGRAHPDLPRARPLPRDADPEGGARRGLARGLRLRDRGPASWTTSWRWSSASTPARSAPPPGGPACGSPPIPSHQLLVERPGDVVVLAGKNGGKARVMRRLHASGLHVLADKPWLVEPADLAEIRASLAGGPDRARDDDRPARHDRAARQAAGGRSGRSSAASRPTAPRSPPSSRRASITSRSAWTAPRSAAPGGSSIRASRAAARWTSPPTRSIRPSGCSTPTPRPDDVPKLLAARGWSTRVPVDVFTRITGASGGAAGAARRGGGQRAARLLQRGDDLPSSAA